MRNKRKSPCPISRGLDIFGDKWTLVVVRDIIFNGKNTFTSFLKSPEQIATNILSDRLELLLREGILVKIGDGHGRYELTQKGKDLVPILVEMIIWNGLHDKNTALDKKVLKKIQTNKKKFTKNAQAGKVGLNDLFMSPIVQK